MIFNRKKTDEETKKKKLKKKLDEQMDKKRELTGYALKICAFVAIIMSLYQLYSSGIKMLPQMQHKAIHLALALALTFMLYPASKKQKNKMPFYDWIFSGLSLYIGYYLVTNYMDIVYRLGAPTRMDIILGSILIILILEATRRTMGWALVIVGLSALAYAFYGHLIPGPLGHRAFTLSRIVEHMFMTGEGIYGVAIYVTASFVFIFILMGSFLGETGGAQAFIDLAFIVTGKYRGGPAKAAVIGSGLMGTISGSSFANVAGTGTFTIPLMKSVGYEPEFAGGVEAAASSGGQIMPPIMGAAAFIMAEMTGVPYSKLILYALIPAILFYVSVFLMVDLRAAKLGLKGMEKKDLPKLKEVLNRGGFLLLAPISIFYMLLTGYSPIKASFTAVMIVIITSFFRKETRLSFKGFLVALEKGATASLSVIAACAVAGLVVGTVTLTGLGLKFSDLIVTLSHGNLYAALFLTMIASIIMGMGMPTTALYIILGSMVAPSLVKLDVPIVAAHLFIFYYGCMASVTPPVALSSYLAAAIAKGNAVKTALNGLKLASAAFILPFIFALSPELLMINSTPMKTTVIVLTSLAGIYALASSLENYALKELKTYERIPLFIAAILLLIPSATTDIAGLGIMMLIIGRQFVSIKRNKSNEVVIENAS
jgi:TRAP transporter 4TM/12TM fusion protein